MCRTVNILLFISVNTKHGSDASSVQIIAIIVFTGISYMSNDNMRVGCSRFRHISQKFINTCGITLITQGNKNQPRRNRVFIGNIEYCFRTYKKETREENRAIFQLVWLNRKVSSNLYTYNIHVDYTCILHSVLFWWQNLQRAHVWSVLIMCLLITNVQCLLHSGAHKIASRGKRNEYWRTKIKAAHWLKDGFPWLSMHAGAD